MTDVTDDATLAAFGETTEDGDDESSDVESPSSTYGWGEYVCARCESPTDRVWRTEGALVCPDCKSW